jgi:hypothetical protein
MQSMIEIFIEVKEIGSGNFVSGTRRRGNSPQMFLRVLESAGKLLSHPLLLVQYTRHRKAGLLRILSDQLYAGEQMITVSQHQT